MLLFFAIDKIEFDLLIIIYVTMEIIFGYCAVTSVALGVIGLGIKQCKMVAPRYICGKVIKSSGARLLEVRSGLSKVTFVYKESEVIKVKSLGFKGMTYKGDFASVRAIVGPINIREIPFTGEILEIKESDNSIYLYEYKNETIASDNDEALERYIKAQKRNDEGLPAEPDNKLYTLADNMAGTCLLGSFVTGWFGCGVAILSIMSCKC